MKPKLKQYMIKNDPDKKVVTANSPKQALRKLGFKFGTRAFQGWRYLNMYPSHGPVQSIMVYSPATLDRIFTPEPKSPELFRPDFIVDCLEYDCK